MSSLFHQHIPVIAGFIYNITAVMMMGPNKNNQTSSRALPVKRSLPLPPPKFDSHILTSQTHHLTEHQV